MKISSIIIKSGIVTLTVTSLLLFENAQTEETIDISGLLPTECEQTGVLCTSLGPQYCTYGSSQLYGFNASGTDCNIPLYRKN